MNKSQIKPSENAVYLTLDQAKERYQLSRDTIEKHAKMCGAALKIGRSKRFIKTRLDQHFSKYLAKCEIVTTKSAEKQNKNTRKSEKPPWIPCSKKMPDRRVKYDAIPCLITYQYKRRDGEYSHRIVGKALWCNSRFSPTGLKDDTRKIRVLAWMPLCEPYDGDIPELEEDKEQEEVKDENNF